MRRPEDSQDGATTNSQNKKIQNSSSQREEKEDPECVLPLLIPCPNQRRKNGENQTHFIVNPKTGRLTGGSSQLYLEMYNFVGQFLGIALRSNVHLDLSLPSIIWKALVGEPLGWEDFETFDASSCHVLRELVALCDAGELDNNHAEENENDELIQEILDELSWSATTSDGQEVDVRNGLLRNNDDDEEEEDDEEDDEDEDEENEENEDEEEMELLSDGTSVSKKWDVDAIERYCKGNVKCRLLESQAALVAISEGLRSVVPACALGIFAWYELELRVCGRAEIDVDLLKRNTEYDDDVSADEPAIVWLWEVLEEFEHQQR